jgi:plasmid stability protein
MALHRQSPSRQTECGARSGESAHLAEIAEILALGLQRLRARKSSTLSADIGESSLHFSPDQSGHADRIATETSA